MAGWVRIIEISLAVFCMVGCSSALPEAGEAEFGPRPNILLITIDTVRADCTSLHGYGRSTTPFLEELAEAGVRFDRAYSTSSWTVPSIASLMTSLAPAAHGVTRGFVQEDAIVNQQVLAGDHVLLAETLRDAGYRTVAVTSNGHLTAEFGFGQGFDRYVNVGFASALDIRRELKPVFDELRDASPWFLWVHFFDPHAPYEARSATREYLSNEGELDLELIDVLQRIMERDDLAALVMQPGDRTHRYISALYDSEIRFVDDQIREIVEELPLGEGDMVVVTSDHGEEFSDHGDCWHGHSLYDETIRVPLVLRLPDNAHSGTVVGHPVSLIDVMPTILDVLDLDLPGPAQGQSLLAAIGGEPSRQRPVRASLARVGSYEALIEPRFKYIHDLEHGEHALFDIENDPNERTNLLERRADVLAEMRWTLGVALLREPAFGPEAAPLATDHVAELRSLGYVQ